MYHWRRSSSADDKKDKSMVKYSLKGSKFTDLCTVGVASKLSLLMDESTVSLHGWTGQGGYIVTGLYTVHVHDNNKHGKLSNNNYTNRTFTVISVVVHNEKAWFWCSKHVLVFITPCLG